MNDLMFNRKVFAAFLVSVFVVSALLIAVPVRANPYPLGTSDFYLHNSGTLSLDNNAPTATTAKYEDSPAAKFSGGNPWAQIGTWTAAPAGSDERLTELSDLHVWLGLKNSDDQGTYFDLRAEVYKNGELISSGQTLCITGVTRNPDKAKEVTVQFASFTPVDFTESDALSLRVLTRIGTKPDGSRCGGHSSAVGLRLYFDAVSRPARFDITAEQLGPVVTLGYDSTATTKAQLKYRMLINPGGLNGYEGIMGVPVSYYPYYDPQAQNDFYRGATCDATNPYGSWAASNHVTFTYDAGTGKLQARVDATYSYCMEVTVGDLGTLNYLQLDVVNRATGTTVNFNNVVFNGHSLGDFTGSGWSTWYVTGLDFTSSFTIEGDLVLAWPTPPATSGMETNKLVISVGLVA
jgi:hypothetical protein